jgi:S-adenosylmethionine uptake transporter
VRNLSDNTRGALLMTAGMAAFTLNDSFMKALADDLPLFQAIFLRGVATTAFLLLMARAAGAHRVRLAPRDRRVVALRTLAEIGAAYFFITALFHLPLANVTAILQSLPLVITLAGAMFLGEPVGWRRLLAIVAGLIGVLLIVRPGPEGFDDNAAYALASVGCVAVRDLATRRLSREVPSLTVALAASAGVTAFGALGCLGGAWAPVDAKAALQLGGAVGFVILGYLCSVLVMRSGDLGFVAPFRYTALLWALALGFLAFGTWPDPLTLLGAAIVAATGIFTLWRERARRRGQAAAAALAAVRPSD